MKDKIKAILVLIVFGVIIFGGFVLDAVEYIGKLHHFFK